MDLNLGLNFLFILYFILEWTLLAKLDIFFWIPILLFNSAHVFLLFLLGRLLCTWNYWGLLERFFIRWIFIFWCFILILFFYCWFWKLISLYSQTFLFVNFSIISFLYNSNRRTCSWWLSRLISDLCIIW
jgi:hypothetical protein